MGLFHQRRECLAASTVPTVGEPIPIKQCFQRHLLRCRHRSFRSNSRDTPAMVTASNQQLNALDGSYCFDGRSHRGLGGTFLIHPSALPAGWRVRNGILSVGPYWRRRSTSRSCAGASGSWLGVMFTGVGDWSTGLGWKVGY